MTTAIVLAAYGSRHKNAMASLEAITTQVRQTYPQAPVRTAFTSKAVHGHLRRQGEEVNNVPEALEELHRQGIRRCVIQSLHIIPGTEYHELLQLRHERLLADDGFSRIEVGMPLVGGEEGLERVARAILRIMPPHNGRDEVVLLMGHGTMHPGNTYYEALNRRLQELDPNVYLGAMEAQPGILDIRTSFLERGICKVFLLPFLFGAGWHAAKDMYGDQDDSWKSLLEEKGMQTEAVLRGAGEYPELTEIWMDHLQQAWKLANR